VAEDEDINNEAQEVDALSVNDQSKEIISPKGENRAKITGSITGRIIDEFGSPVQAALIKVDINRSVTIISSFETIEPDKSVETVNENISSKSEKDGGFKLDFVEKTKILNLRISHPEYVYERVSVERYNGGAHDMGDIIIKVGGAVSGYVVDENGNCLEGASITGSPKDKEGGLAFMSLSSILQTHSDWLVKSDSTGFFRITGLPSGKVNLNAALEKYAKTTVKDIAVTKGGETGNITITMPLGLTIAGKVVDRDGTPLKGAKATIQPAFEFTVDNLEDLTLSSMIANSTSETKDDGLFSVTGLKKGSYSVRVSAPSFLPFKEEKIKAGASDLLIVLEKGGRLAGQVLDGETGAGIEDFSIEIDVKDGEKFNTQTLYGKQAVEAMRRPVEPVGAFLINGMGGTGYSFNVKAEGYGDEIVFGPTPAPSEEIISVVRLYKESVITGFLIDSAGKAVPDGKVSLEAPKPEDDTDQSKKEAIEALSALGLGDKIKLPTGVTWKGINESKTGDNGEFVLKGISRGAYRVVGSHLMHLDGDPVHLDVGRGQMIDGVQIRLNLAGSIEGTVFNTKNEPLPGANILVTKKRMGGIFGLISAGLSNENFQDGMKMKVSDQEGKYAVHGLEPGNYTARMVNVQDQNSVGGMINMGLGSVMGETGPGITTAAVKAGEITVVDIFETLKGGIKG